MEGLCKLSNGSAIEHFCILIIKGSDVDINNYENSTGTLNARLLY